jgi:ribulose-5-phosphate 4-epimerase/fuculose-1-phosphate aldolase
MKIWIGMAAVLLTVNAGITQAAVDAAVLDDLVAANHILVNQGVLDGFGHVSMRDPRNPQHILLSRSLAPALTTTADILEYDLDCNALDDRGRSGFLERFIHCEIYRARPDVQAVVHSHSPAVIPFGTGRTPLRALSHVAGFLAGGVPVFDIRKQHGMTNMLVNDVDRAHSLVRTLGDKPVALMRGHGDVVVGPSLQVAVYRAVYTEVNARMQAQALSMGGAVTYLTPEEGALADATQQGAVSRPWELWKQQAR